MRYTPKSEEEIAAENLCPEGLYDFEVFSATDSTSKAGNDQIVLELDVFGPSRKYRITDYLGATPKMQWKLRHFMDSVNMLPVYESGNIQAVDLVGACGKAKIVTKPASGSFPEKSAVGDYLKRADWDKHKNAASVAASAPTSTPAESDDDLPNWMK